MLRVGLTGGLASGKSTVAGILRDLGAVVFDADAIVRGLYAPGGAGAAAARELFGDDVLGPDGQVDRARIADRSSRTPPRGTPSRRASTRSSGPRAPASSPTRRSPARASPWPRPRSFSRRGPKSDYDRILLVVAPEAERLRRWEEKGGDAEDARRRIAAQIPPEAARARATETIVNDGTLEDLRRQVEAVFLGWTS